MGQKTRPTGLRLGIVEPWRSRWYASRGEYAGLLIEDQRIRRFLNKKLEFAAVARIDIERTRDQVVVLVHTARPGIVIGRKGQEIDRLKADVEELIGRRTDVRIVEIGEPQRSSKLVADDVAQQLVKRGSFRRIVKRSIEQVMDAGASGVKIELSGRLGGAEMSRTEKAMRGSIPLSTLRRNVEYGFGMARTTMGVIGVKVWIDQGDSDNEVVNNGANAEAGKTPQRAKRTRKR